MKQYEVTGMSCAACQAKVEKVVCAVEGVESCAVNLLTNSMGVEGTADTEAVIKAVENAGYGASLREEGEKEDHSMGRSEDRETPEIKKRLIASFFFLLPLMYVSMGYQMWGWPVPAFLNGNGVAVGIYELLLSGIIMVINQRFFVNGFKGLLHRSPNMDTLVALGSMASFGYSVYALFVMTAADHSGGSNTASLHMEAFYFESAAMIVTLITVGKMLEARSKGKTTDALKALMKLTPQTAVLLRDGEEVRLPVDQIRVGDRFIVRPGDQIPADGIVKEGYSAVNEAAFSGESIPVEKKAGDPVSAATINTSGSMICEAVRVGKDTALSKMIRMVSDAAATKAPIAKLADRVSGVFVPIVIAIAFLTFVIWLFVGQTVGYSIARAVSVLVISCPCALGLATPVAIMVGNGVGAKAGILFKTAAALEQTGSVQIMVLDKTGTVTTGQMQVTEVIPACGVTEEELLKAAASLEVKSEHPIARAISKKAQEESVLPSSVSDFQAVAGNGLTGVMDGSVIYGGNEEFIRKAAGIDDITLREKAGEFSSKGQTVVFFAKGEKMLGLAAVSDTVRRDSKAAVSELKNMGIEVVMLTGDHERTARAIASETGIDRVIASVKPDGKEEVIRMLMKQGRTAMVGDGINDALALTRADVGIAIGAGTDIAMDAADLVLTKSSLMDVVAAVRLSRATLKNIRENLFWAFIYNLIGIPLAAGCFVAATGWSLNPMFGAAAMSLSSFCVVSNALRLNLVKVYDSKKDKKLKNALSDVVLNLKNKEMEEKRMKITVKGMMCAHCEAHVKKALEALDGVESVTADHSAELVVLELSKKVEEADVKAAVEEAGYEYAGLVME